MWYGIFGTIGNWLEIINIIMEELINTEFLGITLYGIIYVII